VRSILFAFITAVLLSGCGGEEAKAPAPPTLNQQSPKALAQSMFAIAKHGNLRALSGIAAPDVAEHDVKDLGTLSTASALEQAEFQKQFARGSVTGERIHGDEAEVDVRVGPDGKKAEKLRMVKIGDKWYLQGF
jgi:hypothetical protein